MPSAHDLELQIEASNGDTVLIVKCGRYQSGSIEDGVCLNIGGREGWLLIRHEDVRRMYEASMEARGNKPLGKRKGGKDAQEKLLLHGQERSPLTHIPRANRDPGK